MQCRPMFNTGCAVFNVLKVRTGRKLCLSAQAAVQMMFRQIKNTHSLRSKTSQDKSSKLREMEKQDTFLTLPPPLGFFSGSQLMPLSQFSFNGSVTHES